MYPLPLGALLNDFLIGYMTLFSIINPFGIAFVFHAKTQGQPQPALQFASRRIVTYSFVVLVASLFIGSQLLRFFGITIPALRIAGGLVVALSGWTMLNAPDADSMATADTGRSDVDSMLFFPLTVPLTTGPGTIAAAIALGANRPGDLGHLIGSSIASILLAGAIAITVTFAYSRAAYFSRVVGHEGTRVITRLSAFLLMCVGVQIVLTGVSDVLPEIIARGQNVQK